MGLLFLIIFKKDTVMVKEQLPVGSLHTRPNKGNIYF